MQSKLARIAPMNRYLAFCLTILVIATEKFQGLTGLFVTKISQFEIL